MRLAKNTFHTIVDDHNNIVNLYDLQRDFADRGQVIPFTIHLLSDSGLEPVQIFGESITQDDDSGVAAIDGTEAAANNEIRILMFTKPPFKELIGSILTVLED